MLVHDRAARDLAKALDSHHLVMTLSDDDDALAAEAALKAGQVFGEMNNIKRARDTCAELIRDCPQSESAKAAGERLAVLAGVVAP